MYTSFTAKNYRCFKDLTIEPLGQINLIAGKNNVGKTALLEALFLHSGAYNPQLVLVINAFRGIEAMRIDLSQWATFPWDSVFRHFNTSEDIELVGKNTDASSRWLWLRVASKQDLTGGIQASYFFSDETEASSSIKTLPVLELEYKETGQSGSFRLITDREGIRPEPTPPPPPFPAFYQGARSRVPLLLEAERFGTLETQGRQDILLQALRDIEPRLSRLAMIVVAGQPMLHGDIGIGRLVPLPVMGEGMVRLTSLVLHIANAPDGVVFVDEIENGFHYSVLPFVWQAILKVAQHFNTQVFATTHSFECIKAAYEALDMGESCDFRLHRLDRINNEIRAVTFNQKQLATAIATDLEVR